MYPAYVSAILGCMVVTGAARSILAKLFFQLEIADPIFVTLLYLGGQAFSLIPYCLKKHFLASTTEENDNPGEEEECNNEPSPHAASTITMVSKLPSTTEENDNPGEEEECNNEPSPHAASTITMVSKLTLREIIRRDSQIFAKAVLTTESVSILPEDNALIENAIPVRESNTKMRPRRSVSTHGLPIESRTERWVSRVPWYVMPVVPALFNLVYSVLVLAAFLFLPASVVSILASGMELVLSVLVTRCVRGRRVTRVRCAGVGVVTIGIIMVGIFESRSAAMAIQEDDSTQDGTSQQVIGILLILGSSIMSAFQDIAEEVFMQEADFPPALLVGMEGLYGLIVALVLYFPLAPLFGVSPSAVLEDLQTSGKIVGLSVGYGLLVTVTALSNVAAIRVTSSMTRNVWKNFRTVLIWIVGLIIFYASGNPALGEEWVIPGSFYILMGFAVILTGVYIYYGKGAKA